MSQELVVLGFLIAVDALNLGRCHGMKILGAGRAAGFRPLAFEQVIVTGPLGGRNPPQHVAREDGPWLNVSHYLGQTDVVRLRIGSGQGNRSATVC